MFLPASVQESGAARTLAKRLERAGLVQDFGQADSDWLATLAAYEEACNRSLRMATFLVDDEQALPYAQDVADDRTYARLAGAVADWQAHGNIGRAMITCLNALLDRLEALTHDETAAWATGIARYVGLRYGPLPRPLPPGAWPWSHTLRAWHIEGHGSAIVCRQIYGIMSPNQRNQAVSDFGLFKDADNNDHPLWLMGWPQKEEDRLDLRAAKLGIDVRGMEKIKQRDRLRRLAERQR
jgi:hypothetical protein